MAAFAGLIAAAWLVFEAVAPPSTNDHAGVSVPRLLLPRQTRDFGALPQGGVLQAVFPVANTGTARLVLVDQPGPCCGRPPDPRSVVVAPGESKQLTVEVDTAQWFGQMEHKAEYSTNDPDRPRFTLTVTARVESSGSP